MSGRIDLNHIAKLSGLRIEESEREGFEGDMEAIIAMVSHLPNMAGGVALDPDKAMKLRADEVSEEVFSRDLLLANAPAVKAGCLAVPKTVE